MVNKPAACKIKLYGFVIYRKRTDYVVSQCPFHRHLSIIDCLTTRTACLVRFISTVKGRSKKKKEKKPITSCASSGHITKLKQSIFLRCQWSFLLFVSHFIWLRQTHQLTTESIDYESYCFIVLAPGAITIYQGPLP